MDKKALKLVIIQQIISCEDEQLLNTLKGMLANFVPPEHTDNDDLVAMLLQGKSMNSGTTSDQDVADLQKSINDIFG